MADFVRIGPHIVSKKNISRISKETDSARGLMIIVWFNESSALTIRFDNRTDLTYAFNDLLKDLT